MKKFNIKKLAGAVMEAICPDTCIGCGEPLGRARDRVFCPSCRKKFLSEISAPCPSCGRSYGLCECRPEKFLPDGFAYFLPYDKADGMTRKALLCCKNRRVKPLFSELAGMMLDTAKKRGYFDGTELVTYIPRATAKVVKRGIDQAEELAREFSRQSGAEFASLIRHAAYMSEQKLSGFSDRSLNAKKSYALAVPSERIAGRRIILIDDIVTTGATVNICTELLKNAGADRVICLGAAKSIKPSLREGSEYNNA